MVTERRSARQAAWWLVCLGTGLGLALGEWVLAPRLLPPEGYYVQPPGQTWVSELGDGVLPGVHGTARCVFTSEGIRADPYSPRDRVRILCIGGSTTECSVLDTNEAWPHLLQDRLRAAVPQRRAWVGNAGRSGLNSRHHIQVMEHVVPQLPSCDMVIHLIGFNDLTYRLGKAEDFVPLRPAEILADRPTMDKAFRFYPGMDSDRAWYQRTNAWRLARRVKQAVVERRKAPELARMTRYDYQTRRQRLLERRRQMTVLQQLPDLQPALAEYQRNLRCLIGQARQQGVRILFLTQPALWHARMTAAEQDLCTFGVVGGDPFTATDRYAVSALAAGMARYNDATRRVCAEEQVECLDLASLIPKDLDSFYDDCHFNEPGAAKVAAAVADYLLAQPPFAETASDSSTSTAARGSEPVSRR